MRRRRWSFWSFTSWSKFFFVFLGDLRFLLGNFGFLLRDLGLLLDFLLFMGGLSSLNVSKHTCDFLAAGNLSNGAGLADVITALVTPIEHVMLVKIDTLADITAGLISDLTLNTGQSMVISAADLLLLNWLVN